jgi:hypothetical protein
MSNRITRNEFTQNLNRKHGVIDLNNLGEDLKKALNDAGVTDAELREVAGPDGQIKGRTEFRNLFDKVDRFEKGSPGYFEKYENPKAKDPVPTESKELYDALSREVTNNRLQARYAQPGTKSAPAQPRLTVDSNAVVVPQKDRKPEVNLNVEWKSQFDFENGNEACFQAATHQCEKYNQREHGKHAPKLNPNANQAIQVAYQEDKKGKVVVDKDQLKIGRDYIDNALDKGYPVNVGVSHADYKFNYDELTDHFVTIHGRGYDEKGRLYYEFSDPGSGDEDKVGRFYVDKDTGKLFKEGADPKSPYVKNHDWEMTKVVTYINFPK